MSEFKLTPTQQAAVDARNCSVLVSAAAGSGKTRVLTERLMARVLEGEDISRFLIITFTRAAAAELRSRILAELNVRSAENPSDRHLRRQSMLLYRAQIGTIDSFCTALVRENAHLLGVSPGFSVLDEERSQTLLTRSLEEVMERAYETIGEDGGLALLVDSVGAGRDDSRLEEIVRGLYLQLQSRPWPEKWMADRLAELEVAGVTDAGRTIWGRYLLDDAAREADFRAGELEWALEIMAQPGNEPLMKGYGQAYSELALRFRDISRAAGEDWDKTRLYLLEDPPRLGRVMKFPDEALKKSVKDVWDNAKKSMEKLRKLLAGESRELLEGIRRSAPALQALTGLVTALEREYTARKRRADVCDFSDVERFCVRLLCDGETGGPTALARDVSGRFAEVMVDEYQDVNEVQELIFQRVSGEGERLFMVGDVKQSIYRFRLAEPSIFNGKYEAFSDGGDARRILLRENFRSRGSVLDACNAVFGRIMSGELGEIEYDERARLVQGASYPEAGEEKPELCILDSGAAGEDGDEAPDKALMEARYVAGRIRAMVDGKTLISDGLGGVRPVQYGDIAVLMRTPKTSAAPYRRALEEAGIPVNARQGGAFFSRPEVSFCISVLAAADNPRQDVPLIAAMRGLPFGFMPDELAAVRAEGTGDFWDALLIRSRTDEKCREFAALILDLRDYAREESTQSVLRRLYDRTGLLAACSVRADGAAGLMQLYEYARQFEEDGNRGLFRFVAWLRQLESRGMEPPAAVTGDAVQLLSVHKSKGLEFPVVFLADNSHGWNRSGTERVLCHTEFGLGMKLTDAERGVTWPTLPWRAIGQKIRIEELSEQERVLYVAMTRARERLIMTCVQPDAEEKLASLAASVNPVSPRMLSAAKNTADWLMRAAVCDGGETITLRVVTPDAIHNTVAEEPPEAAPADPERVEQLSERLAWSYPYAGVLPVPSKLTATEIKRIELSDPDPEAVPMVLTEGNGRKFRRPDFGRRDAPLTGAERGIAEHLVMQYIDFGQVETPEQIREEIERLHRLGFLSDLQADAVPEEDIWAFFRSEVGQRLLSADHVTREFRFSILCPAGRWYPGAPEGEEILLQGVVDCCMEEQGALTILDFKTDAQVNPSLYKGQLEAYAMAMERILQKPVRGAVLWYLRRKQAVWLDFSENSKNS